MTKKDFSELPAWELTQEMEKLCKPLDKQFGIDYITYARYHTDGTYSILFTDGRSVENCFRHEDYCLPGQVLEPGVYTWTSLYSDAVLEDLKKAYGHDHGITLIVKDEDYLDHITFSTTPDNHNILNLYINHPNLVYQLRNYFLDSANELIKTAEENRISLPESQDSTIEDTSNELDITKLLLPLQNYPILTEQGKAHLTPRELSCLRLNMQMHTSKEIAKLLKISHRTVEFHLKNIKEKLNITNKAELYAVCKKNHLL